MKTFFRRAMGSYPASLFILSVFLVGNACGSGRLYASECVTVPSGMVSWWPGEGDGQDYGPHGLTGELLSGTAFGVGMVGRAFQGLSEGTGVRVSNSEWLRPTNLSVAAWIQSEGPDPYANVVAKSFGGTMASYALYCTAGRQLAFYVNTSGPTGWARSGLAPLSLWDGRFHFVVGTYDNTRVRLYVDGEEIGTGESASGSPRYSSSFMGGDLFLGTYEPETSGEHPFRGQYDEVAIWNRALSIEEIRLLFEAGSAGMCRVRRREFTAAEDFATDRGNPNGSWSYGWMPSDWAAFTLFGHHGVGFEGSPFWNRDTGDQPPVVWRNTSTETPWGVPPGYLALHPGPGNEASVVRWTAPDKGDAKLVGRFLAGDGGAMSVTVRKGGATLWQAVDSGTFDLRTNVLMGDTIDFAVYGGYAFANTPLELHVTLETEVREEWTVEKLPSGLVHWWSGDGHAEDRVGHQNGRLEGAVFAPGKVGQAFRFQGDWGRVSIDVPAPVGAFTVEAWVRYTGDAWGKLGNGWSTILEFPIDDPTFGVRDTGELDFWPTLQGGQVPVKTWTHVAYTWDLVAGVLYVNGASVASTNLPPRAGGRSLTLGSGTGDAPWLGEIDEVRIYDRALTAAELKYLVSGPGDSPFIVRQPTNTVARGDVSFSVEAVGRPPLFYQWFHDGRSIPGATGSVFSLASPNIDLTSAGIYRVVVSNLFGATESTPATLVVPPDLSVGEVIAPATAWSGGDVKVSYVITNRGPGRTPANWRVRVLLATDALGAESTPLETETYREVLEPGATLAGSATIPLPPEARGNRWLVVRVDPANSVLEADENNNQGIVAILVAAPELPDLAVRVLEAPASIRPGQTWTVLWSVTNQGTATAVAPWRESLLLSNVVGGLSSLAVLTATQSLPVLSGLVRTQTMVFPVDGEAGSLTLWVDADAQREVVEADEGNNRALGTRWVVPKVLTLQWSASEVREDGKMQTGFGVVVRNGDRSEPLVVSLASNDQSEVKVPEQVLIPAGETTAGFWVEPQRDGVVDGDQAAWIEASAPGFEPAAEPLTVRDMDQPRLSLVFAGVDVREGGRLAGTVTREGRTGAELVVSLASSDPSEVRVPQNIVIPAQSLSAAFSAEATEDWEVEGNREITVTAMASGWVSATATAAVRDNDVPRVLLALSNSEVSEGAGAVATTATFTRDPVSPRALTLELFSTGTNAARVPPRVVIPAYASEASVAVAAVDDALVDGPQESWLGGYVLADGSNRRVAEILGDRLVVTDDDTPTLRLSVSPEWVREGIEGAATLRVSREPVGTDALTIQLVSNDPSEASVPGTVVLPPGVETAHVPLTTVADGTPDGSQAVVISASAAGFVSGSTTLTVSDLDLPDLAILKLLGPDSAETDSYVEIAYRVGNEGFARTPTNLLTRIYLSSDAAFGDDTLVGQLRFPGSLAPGQYFEQALQIRLPSVAGEYWLLAETDPEGAVGEGLESNNRRSSPGSIRVTAAYGATVTAAVDRALAGTPVVLSGRATRPLGGPAAFRLVHVHVWTRGTDRILAAVTDGDGRFETVFQPLPTEAGAYEVFATHPGVEREPVQDSFDLLGLSAEPREVSVTLAEGGTQSGTLEISNPGQTPLQGIATALVGLPSGVSGDVRLGGDSLEGGGRVPLVFNLVAVDGALGGEARIRLRTAEDVVVEIPIRITVVSGKARWVEAPSALAAGMVRGGRTLVEVEVVNRGAASSPPATVSIPAVEWLRLVSLETLPSLGPGDTNRVVLALMPAVSLPVGDYEGGLVIDAGEASLNIPFRFRCLSEAKGNLRVEAEDEYTYFADGNPRLAQAKVTVRDTVSGEVVREGFTDVTGAFNADGLPESYYRIAVEARDHDDFEVTRLVLAGETQEVTAFLRRQTVRYHWSVVPTEIEDRTRIVLETVFEASVPAPVVTVEPASIDLALIEGHQKQIDLKVTNHGLIAADDVRLEFPSDPDWRFTPLVSDLGTVPALSSYTIPLLIERVPRGSGLALASFNEPAVGDCVKAGTACGQYWCGRWVKFCQPIVLQRLRGDCGSSGTMRFPELKFRGDWQPTQSGTVSASGGGGRGWAAPPFHVVSPSTCQECIKVFATVLAECSPEQIAQHEAGWYLAYNLACRGEAPPGFTEGDVLPAVLSHLKENCPPADSILRPPPLDCFTLALICPGWATDQASEAAAPARVSQRRPPSATPERSPPSEGAEGGVAGLVPAALRRQIPMAQTLAERLDRVEAVRGVWRVIFGEEVWMTVADAAGFDGWMRRCVEGLEAESEAGRRFSDGEHQRLLDSPLPEGLSWESIDRWVARVNRTAEYNDMGIFNLADLVTGQSQDFIGRDSLSNAVVLANAAISACRAEGFANVLEAANRAYFELRDQLLGGTGGGGVCAQVRLRIEQEAVLTRDAFEASLEVENGVDDPIEDVAVEIAVRDLEGRDASGLFGIRPPRLDGLSAVDGTGGIGPQSTGRSTWTLIPGHDAAPEESVEYAVSGTLRYRQGGVRVTVPLTAVTITVHPSPRLFVKYFHERNVFADDPYTAWVEPSVPFNLAVMVENRGRGDAKNVRVISGQPEIVENEKGLFVDFRILATEVAGRAAVPSLTADFGTITNGQTVVGRWLLESTLQGLFVEYSATFEHLDGLGMAKLSLIDEVTIHEMIRWVRAPGIFEDGKPDFLVNDTPDANDFPDALYLSDGRTNRVTVVEHADVDGKVSASRQSVSLTASVPAGWVYLNIPDPGAGRFRLTRVRRSDGVEVMVGTNVWVTDRTFRGLGWKPIREDRLHLLDHDSPGRYTLEYAEAEVEDAQPPESRVAVLPEESPSQFRVAWEGEDSAGGSGLAYFDVYVSIDGAPFSPWLERTVLRSALYVGRPDALYAFYSVATDRAGNRESNPGIADAATRSRVRNQPPRFGPRFQVDVDEGRAVETMLSGTDPDSGSEDGRLSYRLGEGAPPGADLDPATARFRWSTGEANGPGVYDFTVVAVDGGLPPLTATGQVQVVVREVNRAPALAPIPDLVMAEGFPLAITNVATDPDWPVNSLRFAFGAIPPTGAILGTEDGILRWTPTDSQGPSTNRFEIVVSDGGSPPLSAVRVFHVVVRDTRPDFELGLGEIHVFPGETASVPLWFENALELSSLRFVLKVPADSLGNFGLQSMGMEVESTVLTSLGPGLTAVDLKMRAGVGSMGRRDLGQLQFTAMPGDSSSVARLELIDVEATRVGVGVAPRGLLRPGRVIVIGAEPVLTMDHDSSTRFRLYGRPGRSYVLEVREALLGAAPWQQWRAATLVAPLMDLPLEKGGETQRFYRAVESSPGAGSESGRK